MTILLILSLLIGLKVVAARRQDEQDLQDEWRRYEAQLLTSVQALVKFAPVVGGWGE